MGLLDDVSTSVEDVLDELFDDDSLVREVTYKQPLSRAYDEDLGYTVPQRDNKTLSAIRLRHNTETVNMENSNVEVGDWFYLFKAGDMPDNLSTSDIIQDGTRELAVKAINDGFNFVYLITVSGSGL